MKREDPNFVPPKSAHAGALSEFNSKFASGVSLSEKRPRDDDGPAGREAKREKQQESDEEMELDDDDDEPPPSKGEFLFLRSLSVFNFPHVQLRQQRIKCPLSYFSQIRLKE